MAGAPRAELRGRGWILSLQRQRAAPAPGLSSNLGAAPVAALGRRGSASRAAARLAAGERLWVSVTAPSGVAVAARLADGRLLADEVTDEGPGEDAIHRLARIAGAAVDGVGAEDVPVFGGEDADAESLIVTIGASRLAITLVRADAFDAQFGAPPAVEGEPAVYEGWRLP